MNTVRKIEKIRFYITMLLVGILFVAISCVVIFMPKPELIGVEGAIQRIETYLDSSGEEQSDVFVSYTDENGVYHENVRYPSYSSSMKEGKTVTVLHDPSSPERIQAPGAEFIPYVFVVIGVAAIAFAIYKIATGKKKPESNSPFEDGKI